jgi:hypothetical protein
MSNIFINSYYGDIATLGSAIGSVQPTAFPSLDARLNLLLGQSQITFNRFDAEIAKLSSITATSVNPSTYRFGTSSFTVDVTGTFSLDHSTLTKITIVDKASGATLVLDGVFKYPSLPFAKAANVSHIDAVTASITSSVPGLKSGAVRLEVSADQNVFSGDWTGSVQTFKEIDFLTNSPFAVGTSLGVPSVTSSSGGVFSAAQSFVQSWRTETLNPVTLAVRDTIDITGFSVDASRADTPQILQQALAGADKITVRGAGATVFDAGGGPDLAFLPGPRADYQITQSGSKLLAQSLSRAIGDQSYDHVERLVFSDTLLAFDASGAAGQAYRVYQAAFNRTPDQSGLSYWVSAMDKGASLRDVAAGFSASSEFKALYGANPSAESLVNGYYTNVLGRAPEKGGFDYWVGVLKAGASAGDVLASVAESAENVANVAPRIANGVQLDMGLFL